MNENKDWPRDITIQATLEKTRTYLDEDYDDENEGDDALLVEQGNTMEEMTIESWADIPKGYEPTDPDEREEFYAWKESRRIDRDEQ
jgi:hypothetical protein